MSNTQCWGMMTLAAVALAFSCGDSSAVGQAPAPKDRPRDGVKPRPSDTAKPEAGEDRDVPPERAPRFPDRPPFSPSFGGPGGFGQPFPGRPGSADGRRPGEPNPDGVPRPGAAPMGPGFRGSRGQFGGGAMIWEDLQRNDPEMYELEMRDAELERQTLELSQQYRRAPRDQRESLKKQLQEMVEKHFEARQARRQLQFKRLEEELNRMRSSMDRRTELRTQIVGRRVTELIGEQSELDF